MNSNHTKRNKRAARFTARDQRKPAMKMKLKKGDHVMAVSGKDKGKTGSITRVFPTKNQVIVDGLGVTKRHKRATGGQTARIAEFSRPIAASNFMLVDPKEKKPTRVKRVLKDGKLVRIAGKSGTALA